MVAFIAAAVLAVTGPPAMTLTAVAAGPVALDVGPISTPADARGGPWVSVSAGMFHTCGVRTDHSLRCWGINIDGELGIGKPPSIKRVVPSQVGASANWASVSAGSDHTCAIRTDRSLWCWGFNTAGQLGLGRRPFEVDVPIQVDTAAWAGVSAGGGHTCGVRTDHTLWCWGLNNDGQLGSGGSRIVTKWVPTQVGTGRIWASVSSGTFATCGLRLDHTLWCWGNNDHGQLGLGDTTKRQFPHQVGTLTSWERLDVSGGGVCAIRADATLWCWGANPYGQLGQGDLIDHAVPTQVGTATWSDVASGLFHTCGIRTNDTLWCWGLNDFGALGVGDTIDRGVPTKVGTEDDWADVSVYGEYGCATSRSGSLWCWGLNNPFGQLGTGDTRNRHRPVRVG
ncbi:hypothetical protein V3N99_21100 [Dermatophilaceae bacterium Soc4.6]